MKSRIRGFEGSLSASQAGRVRVMLKNYKELTVWQKSYQLCLEIYRLTKLFPDDERYGLTSQIRRAAVSIPSNIAEGYGRKTTPEYIHSLFIAYGSICELETQILLSIDLSYIAAENMNKIQMDIGDIERMLKALIKSLENKGFGDSRKRGIR
jgi:four helix bundle protein